MPDVGEQQHREQPGQRLPDGDGPSSSTANAGTATTSTTTRNANSSVALATNSAVRSTGASRKPSKPPCSCSATNSRLIAEHRGEQQRHPQHAGGEVAVERVAVQAEVEDHEGRDAEQHHRRARPRGAQLEPQVLAQRARRRRASCVQRPDLGGATSAAGASSATRPARSPSARSAPASPPRRRGAISTRVRPPRGRSAARPRRPRAGSRFASGSSSSSSSGLVQDGAADREALDHPARERAQRLVGARAPSRPRSSSSSTRAARHAVQPRVEAQVLARRQLAVEQRLVREQPDPPAHRPALVGQLARRARCARRRAGAAASRASAAASSCRRRWGRRRRASARAGSVSVTPPSATRSP